MTLTIGRVSGLRPQKGSPTVAGKRVTFQGTMIATSFLQLQVFRQQLIGHADNDDEPEIPVTWLSDSSWDGFYKVLAVKVDPQGPTASNYAKFQVDLERVVGYSNPWFEAMTQAVVRTNAHAITAPTTIGATNAGGSGEYDLRPSLTAPTVSFNRTDEGGNFITGWEYVAPIAATQFRTMTFPASYYVGACRIEVKQNGVWYPFVGRDIPRTTLWRINNGLVRLTAATGTSLSTAGTFEVWDGAAWDSRGVAHWTGATPSAPIGWGNGVSVSTLTILRNSPEQVIIRAAGGSVDYTYSLQKCANIAISSWTSAATVQGGFGPPTITGLVPGAAIAGGGGLRETNNDANGNRMVYGGPTALSFDLTSSAAWATTGTTTGTAFLGAELSGTTAAAHNTAAALVGQFMGAVSWQQRIVPR